MRNFYEELLSEIDFISDRKTLDAATFTYGFIWGRVTLARELQLISDDQMSHIQKVADEAFEDWKTFFL